MVSGSRKAVLKNQDGKGGGFLLLEEEIAIRKE